jgi:DNA primase
MKIADIKNRLPIDQVLQHYGLKPDKYDRLHCPFHPDKTPSLQVYPKTNTYCCFSSNCSAGTGDAIQFIQLMEKCSKHEALVKATALCGGGLIPLTSPTPAPAAKLFVEADELEKEALMGKVFGYFTKSLNLRNKKVVLKAEKFCQVRIYLLCLIQICS